MFLPYSFFNSIHFPSLARPQTSCEALVCGIAVHCQLHVGNLDLQAASILCSSSIGTYGKLRVSVVPDGVVFFSSLSAPIHFFKLMKPAITARWIANPNHAHIHFPHNFRSLYVYPMQCQSEDSLSLYYDHTTLPPPSCPPNCVGYYV